MCRAGVIFTAVVVSICSQVVCAQDISGPVRDPAELDICILTAAPSWRGTAQERANILSEPVPAAYIRELSNQEPCTAGPPAGHLVQWHLQFGTEQSTHEALLFIADHQHRPTPDGDISQARLWVMAADFWQSARLLGAAQRYIQATERWLALAEGTQEGAELAAGSVFSAEDVKRQAPDVIQRAAVLRAELSGERSDYALALAFAQKYTPADFVTAAQIAYGSGRDFCDWGAGRVNADRLALLSERCDEFESAGSGLWDNLARLNLSPFAPASGPADPFRFATDQAALFLIRQGEDDSIAPGSHSFHDEIYRLVALYIRTAEVRLRDRRSERYGGNPVEEAQFHLRKAFPWISPASHPNLFRRVAGRYLELDALARAGQPENSRSSDEEDRFVIWLREEVALLNRLYGRREFDLAYCSRAQC